MKNEPLILAYDCGTQSTRAILFNKNGDIIGKCKIPFEPYFSLREGWAEQHADVYWQKLIEATQTLKEQHTERWNDIAAVSVTTMRDCCVCVDKNGEALRPIILWLDRREATPIKLPFKNKLIFKLVGMYEPMVKQSMVTASNWIKEYEPEIWQKTYKYLMFSGYMNYKLTGKMVESVASMIGHLPFDYKKKEWMTPNSLTFPAFAIEKEKLCELVEPGSVIGTITKEAAEQTGLPEGVPLIAAGSDKGCETLGTGCTGDGCASLSFGTTATIQFTTDKYVEPLTFMPAYPAMIKGKYNPETQIFRGFWMVTWFKNEFAHKEEIEAKRLGVTPEALLDKMLADIPAGSNGLMLQPYWSPSLKAPEARGAIIGFSDKHTKAHIYKAIIEGIGYGLVEGLREMERRAKYNIKFLTVSGGGSNSDAICQITADMFGLPVKRVQTYETSGLGAAMIGFVGVGEFNDIYEAQESMVHYTDEFYPNEENHKIYMLMYERVYKKMYKRVQPLYGEIKQITKLIEEDIQ
jgi:sugar (pentulose or hexulose) kinase